MTIKILKYCSSLDIARLVDLDKQMIKKYGDIYSEEIWEKENFMYELPGKFDNSFVLFNVEDKPIAYAINSIKDGIYFYTHRFVSIANGGADILMKQMILKGKVFLLLVSCSNLRAISFYSKFGFQIVNNENLIKKMFPNKFQLISSENNINSSHNKYLMKLEIE